MTTLTPTTELEAINTLLSTIGEAPVSTLVGVQAADVLLAQAVLKEVSRKIQTMGWHFNTETGFPLTPDEFNHIRLPENTAEVDPDTEYHFKEEYDLIRRGDRLYDRRNHTYEFQTTIYVNITFLLPFDELPESVKHYIIIKAARIFADRAVGAENMHTYTLRDEQEAWSAMLHAEVETADYNILDDALKHWRRR